MRVKWTTPAVEDLISVSEYIAEDNPEAAARMLVRLEHFVARLAQFPLSGRIIESAAARQWVVPNTPYKVIYRIENEEILILTILHSARDRS